MTRSRFGFSSKVYPGLAKLVEETGELVHVLSRVIATDGGPFDFDGNLHQHKVQNEIADVFAAARFFIEENGLESDYINKRAEEKLILFRGWKNSNK
jgi:NTP pyrophosphatase (non-canonical NTP hydrolase)